jgi:hypothetical protein
VAETIEAEVIPPNSSMDNRPRYNNGGGGGFMKRPGFVMFTTGMLAGLALGFVALYVIKKKL